MSPKLLPANWQSMAACLVLLALACGKAETAPATAPDRPHLILVSIDTLRPDHLGSYGYSRATSPVIDELARESVRFTAAFAPTPWTLPSHASMLTGMHPYEIGIDNSFRTIPGEIPVIAELLARAGYQTAAFVDSSPTGFVGADRGFGRGFESYRHAPHRPGLTQRFDMAATVNAALQWLAERAASRPFFLFLHTKSVHAVPNDAACLHPDCPPYEKPEPWQSRFISPGQKTSSWTSAEDGAGQRYLWSLNAKLLRGELDRKEFPKERLVELKSYYDAGIYYVDHHLGRLFDRLRELELFERSVIVVTSDHGEAFLDHALFMHQEVFDTLLRVPLIIRAPDLAPTIVEDHVALADIVPTVLRQADVPIPDRVTGRPLPLTPATSVTIESRPSRDLFAYYLFPSKFTYQALALRSGKWKLVIHNPERPDLFRRELYNTDDDPNEQQPVSKKERLLDELRQRLRSWLRRPPVAQGAEFTQQELPELEAIRALGYVE